MPAGNAFAYSTKLNTNDYSVNAQRMSNLIPVVADGKIYFAYEAVTSDGAAVTARRIYWRSYTTSNAAMSTHVDISGSDALGWSTPIAVNHAGTYLCGYSKGDPFRDYPYNGFAIKESSDSGATWGSSYTGGGSYNDHALMALYSDGTRCLAITMTAYGVAAQVVAVHRRTSAGTWTATNIWTSASGGPQQLDPRFDYWVPFANPAQNLIIQGTRAVFVSARHTQFTPDAISQLRTLDFTADSTTGWTEEVVVTGHTDPQAFESSARRAPMVMGTDGVIRMVYRLVANGDVMAACKISADCGATWTDIGTPEAFFTIDTYQTQIYWPDEPEDLMSFCLDSVNRWLISFPQRYVPGHMHRVMGSSFEAAGFQYLTTENLTNGSGITWDYTLLDTYPSPSCVYGQDWYRAVSAYDGTSRCQLWMLKSASAGLTTNAGGGGRGLPTRRVA